MWRKILIILVLLISSALSAQDPLEERWNFAITLDETNSGTGLVAYNGTGETHTLLQGLVTYDSIGYRLDSQTALMFLTVNSNEGLYKLTPDSAEPVRYTGDEAITVKGKLLVDYAFPYVLLTDVNISAVGKQALLVNLENNTFEPLPDLISSITRFNCCRFSEDGTLLRYVSAEAGDGKTRALREFDIATGESHVFAPLDLNGFAVPSRYGESWLARFADRQAETVAYKLIYPDGSSQTLVDEPQSTATVYQLFGNYLVSMSLRCENVCDIRIAPVDQPDEAQIFHMQIDEPSVIQWMYVTPDGSPVIMMDETYWLLEDSDTVVKLGNLDFRYLVQSPSELVSPDGRWLLVLDGDGETITGYSVWDSETKSYPLSVETPDNFALVNIFYIDGMFLLRDRGSREAKTWIFRDEGSMIIELPDTDVGIYHEFLTTDSLIYVRRDDTANRPSGVYRYNIEDETFTLLIQNALPLPIRDVSTIKARQ